MLNIEDSKAAARPPPSGPKRPREAEQLPVDATRATPPPKRAKNAEVPPGTVVIDLTGED